MENQNENALPMRRDIGQMSDFGAPFLKSDTARCEPVYNCGDGDFALSYILGLAGAMNQFGFFKWMAEQSI